MTTKAASMTCGICDEKVNKSNHVLVACPYCSYEACRSCCETYSLSQSTTKCMNNACGKEWTRKFIVSAFTKSFVNGDWKKNREKILLDKELALLPATQAVVEEQIRKEKKHEEIRNVDNMIQRLQQKRIILQNEYRSNASFVAREKSRFVRSCPDGDCRGYLSTQWKCGLCESFACPDCHVIIGKTKTEEHTCNPDELATAKLLDKDTKPCPKCSTGIFKIEGCDQMWCTQCRTAFSWKTGRIETRIHNPHFFEWQRRNGGQAPRNPEDIICGREITHNMSHDVLNLLLSKFKISRNTNPNRVRLNEQLQLPNDARKLYNDVSFIVRSILHLTDAQVPQYRVDEVENNQELRIKYMRNQIDKETFQTRVQRENKKHDKKRETYELIQLFVQNVTDIMFRFCESVKNMQSPPSAAEFAVSKGILDEVKVINQYVNDCLADVASTYGTKQKEIALYIGEVQHREVLINVERPLKGVL